MGDKKRPFVFLCTGMSLDGKISNFKKECSAISSCDDREMLYDCRVDADAVMIGGNTLRLDDSGLTVKSDERKQKRIALGRTAEPTKVVAISNANDLKIEGDFFDKGEGERIIFTTSQTAQEKIAEMEKKASVFIVGEKKVDLEKALEILFEQGIKSLMVEGGGELIASLFEKDLVDEINLKIGNLILGGRKSATFVDGEGFDMLGAKKVEFLEIKQGETSIIIKAKVVRG
jgi:2,5-diamino-6-(ribosylamino)-4(3H)-pyrimidinone 5'-phosphate reductase